MLSIQKYFKKGKHIVKNVPVKFIQNLKRAKRVFDIKVNWNVNFTWVWIWLSESQNIRSLLDFQINLKVFNDHMDEIKSLFSLSSPHFCMHINVRIQNKIQTLDFERIIEIHDLKDFYQILKLIDFLSHHFRYRVKSRRTWGDISKTFS